MMRVIAGEARRIQLVTPEGKNTRPTTDRIKETLFNVLQQEIPGCRFLDLFSGSGGIGIEAISRGARHSVFVDNDRAACACIRENLHKTRFEDRSTLLSMEVMQALRSLDHKETFDVIFMDPPYDKGLELKVLGYLAHSELLGEDALIIVEASLDTELEPLLSCGFTLKKVKEYKTNQHIFLTR